MNQPRSPIDQEPRLVSTKFAPPRVGWRHIARTRLLAELRQDQHRKLTLVTGSVGFGKTTLLAQWRQELMRSGFQVAWLSLTEDERDLDGFRTYLLAACARLATQLGDALADQAAFPEEDGITALVNGLAGIDQDLYLILDDYHHVDDPQAHRLVRKLLELSPGNLHLVISARTMPPLAIARLRVMGEVADVSCADLPFELAETSAFLEQNAGSARLGPDEIVQVHELTQGWPASLQLLSLALRTCPERRTNLRSLASRSADFGQYLVEDVIGHLPPRLCAFMESLSILRQFSAPLAAAVTGERDAAALIARLENENILIVRAESDDRKPWFRFHPLFAEFLTSRLARRGAVSIDELHRRASKWFANAGLVIEAVRHASQSGDLASAVAILQRSVPTRWKLSYVGPLRHLIDNLPMDLILANERLLYLGTLTLAMSGEIDRAAVWVELLRNGRFERTERSSFRIALAEATLCLQRDDTSRAMALIAPFRIEDAEHAFERFLFNTVGVIVHSAAGHYVEAHRLLDANPSRTGDSDDDLAFSVDAGHAVALVLEGRVTEARRIASSVYARSLAVNGRQSAFSNVAAVTLAIASYERNRIDEARLLLANRQQALSSASPLFMLWAALCESRLEQLHKSPETALAVLERQSAFFRVRNLDRPLAFILAEQARIHARRGDRHGAGESVGELASLCGRLGSNDGFYAEIPILVAMAQARCSLACGDPEAASACLSQVGDLVTRLGRGRMTVAVGTVAAAALAAGGREREAVAELARVVRLGSELGLMRIFLDEGDEMKASLSRLLETRVLIGAPRLYAQSLLEQFEPIQARAANDPPEEELKTLLRPREVEVMSLVAAGMTNKRIALTLGITPETVKWNLKNVFARIGVSNRYDALTWTRRHGLIDESGRQAVEIRA